MDSSKEYFRNFTKKTFTGILPGISSRITPGIPPRITQGVASAIPLKIPPEMPPDGFLWRVCGLRSHAVSVTEQLATSIQGVLVRIPLQSEKLSVRKVFRLYRTGRYMLVHCLECRFLQRVTCPLGAKRYPGKSSRILSAIYLGHLSLIPSEIYPANYSAISTGFFFQNSSRKIYGRISLEIS